MIKRVFALLLTTASILSLAGCNPKEVVQNAVKNALSSSSESSTVTPSAGNSTAPASSAPTNNSTTPPISQGSSNTTPSNESDEFEFPNLPALNEWPSAEIMEAMGLPGELKPAAPENVDVSFDYEIYPLNGEDGLMFEFTAEDSAFDDMTNLLWENGYRGLTVDNGNIVEAQDKSEILTNSVDEYYYNAFYEYDGELMKVELYKDSGGLYILIIYHPEIEES